ncbi:MAG: hypothetical protein ACREU3_07290 [Steroidobacteraceae bacterium]
MLCFTVALAAGVALGAPSRPSPAALAWAQRALNDSGAITVVAADPATGTITVKVAEAGASSSGGRVLLSGPGYRIAAVGPPTVARASAAATASTSAAAGGANGGAQLVSLPVEHRHNPIVCQGSRLLHIDSRNLQFDGNALTAESGCQVYITNSRIVAGGLGIFAQGASVHIDNSAIEGGEGSVEASDGAQVYARSSTFKGLIRREGAAAFHDLGGNVGD